MKSFQFLVLFFLFSFTAVHAEPTGEQCVRNVTLESLLDAKSTFLTEQEKADLNQGHQIIKYVRMKSGFLMAYVFQLAGYDAEFVMAVYSRVGEHAGPNGLGDFIVKSEVQETDPTANPFHVFYEQHVSAPYANGEYTNLTWVSKLPDGSYQMDAKLLEANDASFAPQWLDGYLRAFPYQDKHVFVVACNYMIPQTTAWQGKYNDTFRERMELTGKNLNRWLSRVWKDQTKTQEYRERLRAMLTK